MPYAEVEPDEVKARLARGEDVFLLDVREPDEVEAWAYPIGVNIPLGQLGERLDELPQDVTIVVACHVGRALRRGGAGAQRRRMDGREPDRWRGRLGGRGARRVGPVTPAQLRSARHGDADQLLDRQFDVGPTAFVVEDDHVFEAHEGSEYLAMVAKNEGASWLLGHTSSLKHLRRARGDPGQDALPARIR